jgi:hypothetical protein
VQQFHKDVARRSEAGGTLLGGLGALREWAGEQLAEVLTALGRRRLA